MSFVKSVSKAREFDLQEKIVNNVDGLNAGIRGRNQNGRPRNGNREQNGNRNQQNGGIKCCDFCKRPNHSWRNCFLLLTAMRLAHANHARMDERRDQILAQCNDADRRKGR